MLASYCRNHPESDLGTGTDFGIRADTEHYTYMLRLNPQKGEYNLYCYCYVRQWLERHMKNAEKGIRFITPNYDEKFRIADGDYIRITYSDGKQEEQVCRYVDDTHFDMGVYRGGVLHICQFAEQCEKNGVQEVIPLRRSLPHKCCSILDSTGEIIFITKGERGYVPKEMEIAGKTPREVADDLNQAMGITKAQEAAMVVGSMFGWQVPGADPRNYDDNGEPIRPKSKDRDARDLR